MNHQDQPSGQTLTREQILAAMAALSEQLGKEGTKGEVCLFGGTVMVLAFTARLSTKDVDALFQPPQKIRELAARIAENQGLHKDWLNDAVKGFISVRHETTDHGLPQFDHLHLTMPVPEYLLAMKCMAARLGGTTGDSSDVADIRFLINRLNLQTSAEVLDIVACYYPSSQIPVKTQYLIEGLFEEEAL
jgi:hypothetical protein